MMKSILLRLSTIFLISAVAAGCGGGEKAKKDKTAYIQDLSSNNYLVRLAAVDYLSKNAAPGDKQAVLPLLKEVREGNETIRGLAVKAVGRIGDSRAIPELLKAAESENSRLRYDAVAALGSMLEDERVRLVVVKALDDEDSFVRYMAVVKLGETGQPEYAE